MHRDTRCQALRSAQLTQALALGSLFGTVWHRLLPLTAIKLKRSLLSELTSLSLNVMTTLRHVMNI